ncbi:MAG: hypothetical protein JSR64_13560, partial [Nitrospira sp.]|nr:hypothetical protein [Nitrospira sp.]
KRLAQSARFVTGSDLHLMEIAADAFTESHRGWRAAQAEILRLSADHAKCKGENTKLREDVLRTLDDIDRCVKTTAAIARDEIPGGRKAIPGTGVEISLDHITDATRELRAALAPASGEKAT